MDITKRRITKIAREVSRFAVRTLRRDGVGSGEFDVIHAIRKNPGITQAKICEITGLDKGAVTRQTANLEEKGYLIRKENPADGRSRLLFATEKAEQLKNSKAHIEAKFTWDIGATENEMQEALLLIRQAQWRWDFGVSSHGGSFHAPQETMRILGHGLNKVFQARMLISKVLVAHGYTDNVPLPDITTKEKAQQYIGLDMAVEKADKDKFLKEIVPEWLQKAKANGRIVN